MRREMPLFDVYLGHEFSHLDFKSVYQNHAIPYLTTCLGNTTIFGVDGKSTTFVIKWIGEFLLSFISLGSFTDTRSGLHVMDINIDPRSLFRMAENFSFILRSYKLRRLIHPNDGDYGGLLSGLFSCQL